jgi:tRNA threonylcarbamoyladenosine biosynthesis protein TsaE
MQPTLLITKSPEETKTLAFEIARVLHAGDCLALYGDLGSGKTVFASGLKEALGAEGEMQSPTFTLLRSYDKNGGTYGFHHFDAYRLGGADEWFDLGFDDLVEGDHVSLIEWADIVEDALPERTIRVKIERSIESDDDNVRSIELLFPKGDPRVDLEF